jgi:hypothetical protein
MVRWVFTKINKNKKGLQLIPNRYYQFLSIDTEIMIVTMAARRGF